MRSERTRGLSPERTRGPQGGSWRLFSVKITALYCTISALSKTKNPELSGVFGFSVNVGYNTATVAKGNYKAFAVHFSPVENPTAGISVSNLFAISSITGVAAWGGTMDQVWRWDTTENGWVKYGYQKPRNGTAAWRKYDANAKTFSELASADAVLPGETFLYFRGGSATATLTLSGAVKEVTASPTYTIAKGNYQFVARPWPVGFKLSDLDEIATWSAITGVAAWGGTMDQIWRWDTTSNGWTKYGYQKPRNGTAAWRKYDASEKTFSELADADAIAADEGFLYFRGGSATLTLTFKALQPTE